MRQFNEVFLFFFLQILFACIWIIVIKGFIIVLRSFQVAEMFHFVSSECTPHWCDSFEYSLINSKFYVYSFLLWCIYLAVDAHCSLGYAVVLVQIDSCVRVENILFSTFLHRHLWREIVQTGYRKWIRNQWFTRWSKRSTISWIISRLYTKFDVLKIVKRNFDAGQIKVGFVLEKIDIQLKASKLRMCEHVNVNVTCNNQSV